MNKEIKYVDSRTPEERAKEPSFTITTSEDKEQLIKKTGKNFSRNNSNGKRKKSDFYETPYSLTRLLLEEEKLKGSILEPACGNNAIVKVLKEFDYKCNSYDIEKDFLKETKQYTTIITNPPFSLSFDFIEKAKKISEVFYLLLPLSYLHGKKRFDNVYSDKVFPLEKIYVFTRYPLLGEKLHEDGTHNTGMMVYAWFKWNKRYEGNPNIYWLDNDKYIIRKTKK